MFTHACGYYFFSRAPCAATIRGQLLIGVWLLKYGIRILATATIHFNLAGVWLLIEGSFIDFGAIPLDDILIR